MKHVKLELPAELKDDDVRRYVFGVMSRLVNTLQGEDINVGMAASMQVAFSLCDMLPTTENKVAFLRAVEASCLDKLKQIRNVN
jgi:hypothetical protein